LYVGDVVSVGSFAYLQSDPLFSASYVAANLRGFGGLTMSEVRRAVRLYMPRSCDDLVSKYDVIVLNDANVEAVGVHNIEMLSRGVAEGAMGLLMTGGWSSFGGAGTAYPPWGETSIGPLLPTTDVVNTWVQSGRVVIDEPENEFIRSLPWGTGAFMRRWDHNLVTLKAGAQKLAHTENPGNDPLMATWSLGTGTRAFSLTGDTDSLGLPGFVSQWEYANDFVSNIVIYVDRRRVPQDVALVHRLRSEVSRVKTRRSLLLGLLDFAESFGANTRAVAHGIVEVDDVIASAASEYLKLRFPEALRIYEKADEMLVDLDAEAIELKNRALLWVHLTEYSAVTGVAMISAIAIWSLMIRRRLYRRVKVTRFVDSA